MSRAGAALSRRAHAGHRGHPRRHHPGGHRAHHPPVLVPAVPRYRRAGGHRCLAGLVHRAAGGGAVGLAALPAGRHAVADRRRLQLPPALQALLRRPGADVATTPRDPPGLGPGDPVPGAGQRGAARGRDRLAGRRPVALAVVFHHRGPDLLHDRSQSRLAGAEAILQEGVRRGPGDRLLVGLQRGRLRGSRSACPICCAT